jgi:uncharacterized repeat protein (TIGR01451 family)
MHRLTTVILAATGLIGSCAAHAAGTLAGTAIENQAEIVFSMDGDVLSRASNVTSLRVAEIVDVDLLLQTPTRLVVAGDQNQPLYFTLANTGNGQETFSLTALGVLAGDAFDPVLATNALVFDTDGSGDLSAADVPYVPGTNDPSLAPDELIGLMLLADIPAGLLDGAVGFARLGVAAVTGTGVAGTVFAGAGEGGVDAVIGPSEGTRAVVGEYVVGQVGLQLTKSAVISDPSGGARAVPGASITYTIEVTAQGTGTAIGAVVEDPIPDATSYVTGSLRLNGTPLTDTADLDAGELLDTPAAPAVVVRLGDLSPADTARVIEFEVTIN